METVVNILGTEYTVIIKKNDEDEAFDKQKIDGYCDNGKKLIVICDLSTCKDWAGEDTQSVEAQMKQTLRHEIVHAFLNESGLRGSSMQYGGAWAKCEEMIDWISIQGPKVYAAWQSVNAL